MAKKTIKQKAVSRWSNPNIISHSNTGEIITKPNQSQTIREILFRNTAGMTYDNYKTPYYEEQATFSSQSLNKIQEMEPVEKLQYLKEINSQVETLQQKIKSHQAEQEANAKLAVQSSVTDTKTEVEGNE